jgi:hypothetical protein
VNNDCIAHGQAMLADLGEVREGTRAGPTPAVSRCVCHRNTRGQLARVGPTAAFSDSQCPRPGGWPGVGTWRRHLAASALAIGLTLAIGTTY